MVSILVYKVGSKMSEIGWALFLVLVLVFGYLYASAERAIDKPNLKIGRYKTKNIKAAVIFVTETREGRSVEDLLAYQVINQIAKSEANSIKYVWLLHTEFGGDNSSNANAKIIFDRFNTLGSIKITPLAIPDILDTERVFQVVQSIINNRERKIKVNDIICDCTAGPKPVTLGIALAAIGRARLVYFPQSPINNDSEYIEIDASSFIQAR